MAVTDEAQYRRNEEGMRAMAFEHRDDAALRREIAWVRSIPGGESHAEIIESELAARTAGMAATRSGAAAVDTGAAPPPPDVPPSSPGYSVFREGFNASGHSRFLEGPQATPEEAVRMTSEFTVDDITLEKARARMGHEMWGSFDGGPSSVAGWACAALLVLSGFVLAFATSWILS